MAVIMISQMRASLFNLVVVTPDNPRLEYLRHLIGNVISRFPCRVLLIKIGNAPLKTAFFEKAERGIVCDEIDITIPERELHKIPFLILPQFLPDLPIYVLWAEDPASHAELHAQLEKWATRFIYDSETAADFPTFCKTIAKAATEVSDLNWARIESWRALLAATFYSEARLNSLRKAESISVHYNALETPFFCHTEIQSLYLITWLKTRLAINPKTSFHPENNKHLPPGAILSIDILCRDETHFSFRRDTKTPEQIAITLCDEEKCEIPSHTILSKTQAGLSLVNQTYHSDPSPHFMEVLRVL